MFLMTGIMDLEAMFKADSFWSKDSYLRNIVDREEDYHFWDQNFREDMDVENRAILNRLLFYAASEFEIPLLFVSTPHQLAFQGRYIKTHFQSEELYSVRVRNRCSANHQIEELCRDLGIPYFDIQSFSQGLDGAFYDDIHLTGFGAARAAGALIEGGFADALRERGVI